jgi:hypothetical protein
VKSHCGLNRNQCKSAFPCWLLSHFSYWLFLCLLLRNVYFGLLFI